MAQRSTGQRLGSSIRFQGPRNRAWRLRQGGSRVERPKGLEPSTFSLGSCGPTGSNGAGGSISGASEEGVSLSVRLSLLRAALIHATPEVIEEAARLLEEER